MSLFSSRWEEGAESKTDSNIVIVQVYNTILEYIISYTIYTRTTIITDTFENTMGEFHTIKINDQCTCIIILILLFRSEPKVPYCCQVGKHILYVCTCTILTIFTIRYL